AHVKATAPKKRRTSAAVYGSAALGLLLGEEVTPVRGDYEEQSAQGEQCSCNDHPEPTRRQDNAVPSVRPLHFGERSRHDPYSRDQEQQEGHLGDPHAGAMREGEQAHVETILVTRSPFAGEARPSVMSFRTEPSLTRCRGLQRISASKSEANEPG